MVELNGCWLAVIVETARFGMILLFEVEGW